MREFGKRLKSEREKRKSKDAKWTQEFIADAIGVARPTYTAYENGTKQPPLETVNKIADLLDLKTDYLLGRTDDSSPSSSVEIPSNINVADLDGVKHDLTPEVARRLREDIKLFEELKKQWKEQQDK